MLMMMLIGFIGVSVAVELSLVKELKLLRRLVMANRALGIALSVGLSWLLGHLFAAGGLIVLMGSIGSSLVTAPVYAVMARWKAISAWATSTRATLLQSSIYRGLCTLRALVGRDK